MRFKGAALFVAVMLGYLAFVQSANAFNVLTYKATADAGRYERFKGDERLGLITSRGLQLFGDDLNRTRRLALEYAKYDNGKRAAKALDLTKEELSLAGAVPLGTGLELALASSISRYEVSDDFWTAGLYPSYKTEKLILACGFERDADKTSHADGTIQKDFGQCRVFMGASRENHESHGQKSTESRAGLGLQYTISAPQVLLYGGLTGNPEDRSAWIAGIARFTYPESSQAVPTGFLAIRQKPESFYALGIVALGGKALSQHSCPAIFTSFARGSLSRSRVVRNRDFQTLGVGQGYDQVDFGTLTASGTKVEIEMMPGISLVESEYAVTAKAKDRSIGPLRDPFCGLAYTTSTDIVSDPVTHNLSDPGQHRLTATIGATVRLAASNSPRSKAGLLRVQADARFDRSFDGAFAKATYWF